MEAALISPAGASFLGIPLIIFSILIPVAGVGLFAYIMAKRLAPLVLSKPDYRFDRIPQRLWKLLVLWLGQFKQPRYMIGGVLHILIFAGFIVLSIRSMSLVVIGIDPDFVMPGFEGPIGFVYNILKDYAATWVLVACIIAIIRRVYTKPERYKVPEKYGKDHTGEAVFVLIMICTLMISESLFEATAVVADIQTGAHASHFLAPLSLAWFFKIIFAKASMGTLQTLHLIMYYIHDITFFSFLCFLPLGKHFHVITSIFNVFFMKLDKGSVKPVRWGISDEELDDLDSFGVKKITDFTWKHILDFYSCADCGRCSDQCPANAVGRPLSPRFISIKCRDHIFNTYPLLGDFLKQENLIEEAKVLEEDEIWSCTTCGACEEECPLTIEYIDKIVDLRRGMVDEGNVPQSLQKPLEAIGKRGNPWGKMEKKRADWTKAMPEEINVKVLDKKTSAEVLFFLDSITSYDDRIMQIGQAAARVMAAAGIDFGILGKAEKDSGHEVRRFGEEMLFQQLRDDNTGAILNSGAQKIITADPHAFNALMKDYKGLPPVEHVSTFLLKLIQNGDIALRNIENPNDVFVYHDPCYLGRHNLIYDEPRQVLDSIPGLRRTEMTKCRDRSFCCGGGGLMLFYEPIEETRMGKLRVEMAKEAGATVIVTACPFCMVNIEDAIKTSGLEGQMQVIDLVELVNRHLKTEIPEIKTEE